MIFIWKISQGLVSTQLPSSNVPAKEDSLHVRGCQLFNLLPAVLRSADHGDTLMFKNNLDHYLSCVPDQPTTNGSHRAAKTNSLLHQVPMMGGWE